MSHAILVVDDEERLGDVLAAALEDLGYRATAVTSAKAALLALEQSRFDLVLTDLRMPVLDGRGLLREARSRWPDLPVIILTAFAAVRPGPSVHQLVCSLAPALLSSRCTWLRWAVVSSTRGLSRPFLSLQAE